MSHFVNYTRREGWLPEGSKGLAELLRPPGSQAGALVGHPGPERPVVTRGERTTAGVRQVEGFLTKLFASQSEFSTLMISSKAEDVTVLFYRCGSRQVLALILIAREARLEQTVREFFGELGVKPVHSYPVPKQEGGGLGWGLVFPMPALVVEASRVTGELLRRVGQGGDESVLHFRYYHLGG